MPVFHLYRCDTGLDKDHMKRGYPAAVVASGEEGTYDVDGFHMCASNRLWERACHALRWYVAPVPWLYSPRTSLQEQLEQQDMAAAPLPALPPT